mgnify:FL=1
MTVLCTAPQKPRREYTIKITRPISATLEGLAKRFNLYTPEGRPREAEIVRVLLVCALTEGLSPREQAALALYVNGLMLVSQGFWLGFYDVRDDICEVASTIISIDLCRSETRPGNPPSNSDRERFHVKVDSALRSLLVKTARENGFITDKGLTKDAAFVARLVEHAVANPNVYEQAFTLYAKGIMTIRAGLVEGLTAVRDSLRVAVTETAGV